MDDFTESMAIVVFLNRVSSVNNKYSKINNNKVNSIGTITSKVEANDIVLNSQEIHIEKPAMETCDTR